MRDAKRHFTLKWKTDDPSSSIILAFSGLWHVPITNRQVSVIFRKKGPQRFTPDWVYAYIAIPTKAIVAKLEIDTLERLSTDQASQLARSSMLTPDEIRKYAGEHSRLFVYRVGTILVARKPITLTDLIAQFNYWPSSNYTPLSAQGVAILDNLGKRWER